MKREKYNITMWYDEAYSYDDIIRILRKEKRRKKIIAIAVCLVVVVACITASLLIRYDELVRNYCELELSTDKASYSVTKYEGSDTQVIIPTVYRKKPITNIGYGAFSGNETVTYVTIPNTVVSIGEYAFSNCTSLVGIGIPDTVVSIGDYTFSGCTSLTDIVISNSVTDIGDYAFANCTSIIRIRLPNTITNIGSAVFDGCKSFFEITFEGTQEEWYAITKADDWDAGIGFYVVYCEDVTIFISD